MVSAGFTAWPAAWGILCNTDASWIHGDNFHALPAPSQVAVLCPDDQLRSIVIRSKTRGPQGQCLYGLPYLWTGLLRPRPPLEATRQTKGTSGAKLLTLLMNAGCGNIFAAACPTSGDLTLRLTTSRRRSLLQEGHSYTLKAFAFDFFWAWSSSFAPLLCCLVLCVPGVPTILMNDTLSSLLMILN